MCRRWSGLAWVIAKVDKTWGKQGITWMDGDGEEDDGENNNNNTTRRVLSTGRRDENLQHADI